MKSAVSRIVPSVVVLLAVVACDSNQPAEPVGQLAPKLQATSEQRSVPEFRSQHTVDIELSVEGELKPGGQNALVARIQSLTQTGPATVHLKASQPLSQSRTESVERTRSVSLAPRGEVVQSLEARFDKPGYYHVLAQVATEKDAYLREDGTLIVPSAIAEGWVLVTENGGRFDAVYDTTVAAKAPYGLLHGTSGEFREAPKPTIREGGSGARLMSTIDGLGVLTYQPQDADSIGVPRRPVPYANISGYCIDVQYGTPTMYVSTTTDVLGRFTVTCYGTDTHFLGNYSLQNNTAKVPDSHAAFYVGLGGTIPSDIYVARNSAARVYLVHNRYLNSGEVASRFGVSRPLVEYIVGTGPSSGGSRYESSTDKIHVAYDAAMVSNYITYLILHEYGHAFNYVAMEAPVGYYCASPGNNHGINMAINASCAFVEGFANFFSAWLSDRLGDVYSPTMAEENESRLYGNGLIIEGAVSGFLFDLVDNASTYDGISGDDDTVSISGATLLGILRSCRFHTPNRTQVSRSDELVYCLEGTLTSASSAPVAYQSSFATYLSLTYDFSVTLPSLTDVRALWRKNFYNL